MKTSDITDEQIAELEHLAKAATQGPWFLAYNAIHSEPRVREYDRLMEAIPDDAPYDDPRWAALPKTVVATVPQISGDTPTDEGIRNGNFIASLYPERILSLIAYVRKTEAERDCAKSVARARKESLFDVLGWNDGSSGPGEAPIFDDALGEVKRLREVEKDLRKWNDRLCSELEESVKARNAAHAREAAAIKALRAIADEEHGNLDGCDAKRFQSIAQYALFDIGHGPNPDERDGGAA